MSYTFVDFMKHLAQSEKIALYYSRDNFQTDREREAYSAGFQQGGKEAKEILALHAGLKLS